MGELDRICRIFINAAYNREPAKPWEWMEDVTHFKTYADTTLNGAITTASTSVILTDASNFDSSGRIWAKTSNALYDFIDYTGKSSNTLSGATDIDVNHSSGETVGKLYALPSNYGKAVSLQVNGQEFLYTRQNIPPTGGQYTTRGAYILFPEGIGARDCTLVYGKAVTALTSTGQTLQVPTDFSRYLIEMLKAYIFQIDGQDERVPTCRAAANDILEQAMNYMTTTTTSLGLRTY